MDLGRLEEARVEAKRSQEETCDLIRKLERDSVELLAKVRERVDRDESLHELMHYGGPRFSPDEMTEAWLNLLSRLKTAYIATNYIDSHKIYNTNWGAGLPLTSFWKLNPKLQGAWEALVGGLSLILQEMLLASHTPSNHL